MRPETVRGLLYRRDVALARHRAAVARSMGVTDGEMLTLVHLAVQQELSPSALSNLIDLSSAGTTALVQRLERAGHVTRKRHPTDGRSTLISLAAATARRVDEAESGPYTELADAVATLTEAEQRAVLDAFARLASVTEAVDAAGRQTHEQPPDPMTRAVPSLWG